MTERENPTYVLEWMLDRPCPFGEALPTLESYRPRKGWSGSPTGRQLRAIAAHGFGLTQNLTKGEVPKPSSPWFTA